MNFRHSAAALLSVILLVLVCSAPLLADPFDAITVDGTITADGTDWFAADRVIDDSADEDWGVTANTRFQWVTWDETNLYLGLVYQADGAGFRMYCDLADGSGVVRADEMADYAEEFRLPDTRSIGLLIARADDAGAAAGTAPTVYRVGEDGALTDLTASISIAQLQIFQFPGQKGIFWLSAEIALPWSVLYPAEAGTVPTHAALRTVNFITKADTTGAWDTAPDNPAALAQADDILLDTFHVSVIDIDGDGEPDPANASVAGSVTLPNDPGDAVVTAEASLQDWAGGEPGAPLSLFTGEAGVASYDIRRLPAGTYEITVGATEYFTTTTTATVTEGQALTGIDVTLERRTHLAGTVSFALGSGRAGTLTLLGPAGEELDMWEFTAAGGDFDFTVRYSGTYTLRAEAEFYVTTEVAVPVTAGTDVLDLAVVLPQKPEISGTVSFLNGPVTQGRITILDAEGIEIREGNFGFNNLFFLFFLDDDGDYTLHVDFRTYSIVEIPITVADGVGVTDLSVELEREAQIIGNLIFEGPAADGLVTAFAAGETDTFRMTEFTAADSTWADFFLPAGTYDLVFDAAGYDLADTTLSVASAEVYDLVDFPLTTTRATHIEMVDENDDIMPVFTTTVSLPDEGKYFYGSLDLMAVDEDGRPDLYDFDGRLTDFSFRTVQLDDESPTRGSPHFTATTVLTDTLRTIDFVNGRSHAYILNDRVEIVRVYVETETLGSAAGRLMVGFRDPTPKTIVVTVDRDTLVADDTDAIILHAKLFDTAGNPSEEVDLPVAFALGESSTGYGVFRPQTPLTNADGEVETVLTATGAGSLFIEALVLWGNLELDLEFDELGSGVNEYSVTAIAGDPVAWELSLTSGITSLSMPVTATAKLVDDFSNPVDLAGETFTFTAEPAGLGTFDPAIAVSDTNGRATAIFMPTGDSGVAVLSGSSSRFPGDSIDLEIREIFIVTDAPWDQEPEDRQVFPPLDLTALIASHDAETLQLAIPFESDWDGLQLHIVFETGFDAAGGTSDPFHQPVNYGHENLPDYVLTTKYSANDYGDFRRWNGLGWSFWNTESNEFGGENDNQSIQGWVEKQSDRLLVNLPWFAFDGVPDSMRMEAYLTSEVTIDGSKVKRSAFDSVPQDSTLNLTFEYENPGDNDWLAAEETITLEAWSPVFYPRADFPTPPIVSDVAAEPDTIAAGAPVVISALVADAGDGTGDVLANLRNLIGSSLARMHDDGLASHGDETAGDGIYSVRQVIPVDAPGGRQEIIVKAYDADNIIAATGRDTLEVESAAGVILHAEDPVGDDHGPNLAGISNLYYIYPTNSVFQDGSFDLTSLDIYETTTADGEMIVFEVGLANLPDPAVPGTADWNPPYGELNIEKIDIMIDTAPGGATLGLPNRRADFEAWDAWEYAIVMDGWHKAVVPSRGVNSKDAWNQQALSEAKDITIQGNPARNTVTAIVSKSSLGDPSPADILEWDICVVMSGHDFENDLDLGGTRWVNETRNEWQFGGGNLNDHDSNIMDILLVPGAGKEPPVLEEDEDFDYAGSEDPVQSMLLNYLSPYSQQRLADQLTPVAIAMTKFEDTGPPVIRVVENEEGLIEVWPLVDSPTSFALRIEDDFRVDNAVFRYRSSKDPGDGWSREVDMGYVGDDVWSVDILPSWQDSNLVYSQVDDMRYLQFQIEATDAAPEADGGPFITVLPATTMRLYPYLTCVDTLAVMSEGDIQLSHIDGSQLKVSDEARAAILRRYAIDTGQATDDETLAALADTTSLTWDVCTVDTDIALSPTVPAGRSLNVQRTFGLGIEEADGTLLFIDGKLPQTVDVSLHYPQAWVPVGGDENHIGLYEYQERSDRWVLVGGHVNPQGNVVTATVNHGGTFGLFLSNEIKYNAADVLSGLLISPNPFSPNGDGLYDETTISFYLSQEATVTAEIYNIDGKRKRVMTQTYPFAGEDNDARVPRRVPGLIWDGNDGAGDSVPYGVYILRLIVTYNVPGGTRTIRSNHSLVVIR